MSSTYYTADQCLTGGHECRHRHKTAAAAWRCLPSVPRVSSGSLTRPFSGGAIHRYQDGQEVDLTDEDMDFDDDL